MAMAQQVGQVAPASLGVPLPHSRQILQPRPGRAEHVVARRVHHAVPSPEAFGGAAVVGGP
eukprot:5339686-Lingulodinium_polyedra.AAC.1